MMKAQKRRNRQIILILSCNTYYKQMYIEYLVFNDDQFKSFTLSLNACSLNSILIAFSLTTTIRVFFLIKMQPRTDASLIGLNHGLYYSFCTIWSNMPLYWLKVSITSEQKTEENIWYFRLIAGIFEDNVMITYQLCNSITS